MTKIVDVVFAVRLFFLGFVDYRVDEFLKINFFRVTRHSTQIIDCRFLHLVSRLNDHELLIESCMSRFLLIVNRVELK